MFVDCDERSENFGLPVPATQLRQATAEEDYARFKFQTYPVEDTFGFANSLKKSSDKGERDLMNFKKGTTTLAFRFQGGVIVAVDSRASQGSFASDEHVRKIIEIDDKLLGTMAGGAADCQFWLAYLGNYCRLYKLQNGEALTVDAASKFFANLTYRYRGSGLVIGSMIAGSDHEGTKLYYHDNDGNRVRGDLFSVGSGSTYAYGVLDTYYRWDLTVDQAVELGKRAISEATYHDSGSGGCARGKPLFLSP